MKQELQRLLFGETIENHRHDNHEIIMKYTWFLAELIVHLPLLAVIQYVIGFGDALELFFGLLLPAEGSEKLGTPSF